MAARDVELPFWAMLMIFITSGSLARLCSCIRRLGLVGLRDLLGWYYKVSDLRRRRRCGLCGSGHLLGTFLTPAQNERDTKRLFGRKATAPLTFERSIKVMSFL